MSKNILFCALGVIVGFFVGFFVVNSITRPGAQVSAARANSGGDAGPLKPEQMSGQLPPGHPDVGGGGAAATFYERPLAIKPDSPDVRTDLGNTYFNRKDYDRALAEYRKSVAF